MIVTILKVELLSDKSIPTPNPSLILTANHDLLKVRKGGGGGGGKLKKDKTQPDPDCVSLSARSAFTVYANGKFGKS